MYHARTNRPRLHHARRVLHPPRSHHPPHSTSRLHRAPRFTLRPPARVSHRTLLNPDSQEAHGLAAVARGRENQQLWTVAVDSAPRWSVKDPILLNVPVSTACATTRESSAQEYRKSMHREESAPQNPDTYASLHLACAKRPRPRSICRFRPHNEPRLELAVVPRRDVALRLVDALAKHFVQGVGVGRRVVLLLQLLHASQELSEGRGRK